MSRAPNATSTLSLRPANSRARGTNDAGLVVGADGRSARARRTRDLIQAHVADLGGVQVVKTAQLALIRRAAILAVELEAMEACLARGEATYAGTQEPLLDTYGRAATNLSRLLESLATSRAVPSAVMP